MIDKMRDEKGRFVKGNKGWFKGISRSTKTREKISQSMLGKHHTKKTKRKMSLFRKGKKLSEATKVKISDRLKGKRNSISTEFKMGSKHIFWNNGTSFEPYGTQFNNHLKEFIRERDNYTCQVCEVIQDQLKFKLHVHHVDYDKQNNKPENLIPLCNSCHSKTNFIEEVGLYTFEDILRSDQNRG